MTAIEKVTKALDAEPSGLLVTELMARTELGEWTVRSAIHDLQLAGIVMSGRPRIKTGKMGPSLVRYIAVPIEAA